MAKSKAVAKDSPDPPKAKRPRTGSYGNRLPDEWQPVLDALKTIGTGSKPYMVVQMALIAYLKNEKLDVKLRELGIQVPAAPLPLSRT